MEYQLLGDNVSAAIDTMLEHEDFEDAKLVRTVAESGVFSGTKKLADAVRSGPDPKLQALNASLESMTAENRKVLRDIAHQEAEQHFANGEAVLAAGSELAISAGEDSVKKLIRANELFLAYYVAKLLKVPALDHIQFLLGLRAERLGQFEQAAFFYKNSRNPRAMQLFAARNNLDYAKYMPQKGVDYLKMATETKGPDAVYYYILAGKLPEACQTVVSRTKRKFLPRNGTVEILGEKLYDKFGDLVELQSLIQNISVGHVSTEYRPHDLCYLSL